MPKQRLGLPVPETHRRADLLCPEQLKAQQQHVRFFCLHLHIHVQNPEIVALGKGSGRVLCFCGNALTAHESPVRLTPAPVPTLSPRFMAGAKTLPRHSESLTHHDTPLLRSAHRHLGSGLPSETLPRSCGRSLRAVVSSGQGPKHQHMCDE